MTDREHKRRLPDFLYAGAAKAGSFWIYEVLREHPEVYVPEVKDIMFFERSYDLGFEWYLAHFHAAADEKAVGELSHDYFLKREYAERIRRHLPHAKILFCLREGVDRTYSEYLYDRTIFQYVSSAEYRGGFTFEQFARLPAVEHLSDYYGNLRPFYELFPQERILVLFYDDLKRDSAGFARQVFDFLGVDPSFRPSILERKINAARQARIPVLAEAAYHAGAVLRRMGRANIVGSVKRKTWFETLLYRPFTGATSKPKVPPDVVERLYRRYHREYDELSTLIGKPLPSDWSKLPEWAG